MPTGETKNKPAQKTSVSVRRATTKDLEGIMEVNVLSMRSGSANGLIQKRSKEEFEKLLRISKYFIVAESGGEIVGYVVVLDEGAPYPENEIFSFYPKKYKNFVFIDQVAVRPDCRRMGIAEAMYGYFLLTEKKRILVDFLVEPRNHESIAFHEAIGFESIDDFIQLKNGMRAEVYEFRLQKT
jgi:predicted GNAT superfamily acetyltransferase